MPRTFAFLLLLLAGCATPKSPEVGRVDVQVPAMFRHGIGALNVDAPTDYERYLVSFRSGYWDCIRRYVEDINYAPRDSDSYGNGWASEVSGYGDGYQAAERDMQRNFERFGKERTAQYLKDVDEQSGL
jgi:hypothetical protein